MILTLFNAFTYTHIYIFARVIAAGMNFWRHACGMHALGVANQCKFFSVVHGNWGYVL